MHSVGLRPFFRRSCRGSVAATTIIVVVVVALKPLRIRCTQLSI